jgi:glucokinase
MAIGVDVGGTSIKFGLVDGDGTIIAQSALDTHAERGPDAVLERIAEGIGEMMGREGASPVGIGVGLPGVVNDIGEVAYPPNFPGWEIVPVADRLRPLLSTSLPIVVENDANVAGYAEARAGNGNGERNFLFVTLGTGVGGCIIANGRIWRGARGGAGEIGHTSVDMNGQLCNCGARGCVEAYIGQRYMSALARERLDRSPESLLHAMVASHGSLEPRLIDEAATAGDRFAREFLAEMGVILGAALASAMNLCDLHLVIIGGGMSRAEKYLLDPARRSLRMRALRSISGDVELRVSRFLNDAGVIGAAMLAMGEHGA